MMRKGSDLLDVFRSSPRRGSGEGARGGGGGGEGRTLTLGRRHLVVLGAGGVLLVVLAFVAGIGIGRGGARRGSGPDVALARGTARTWRLPGAALPRIGARAEEVVPLVRAALERDWPQLIGHYRIEDVPSPRDRAPRVRFTVFGLRNREEADKWQGALIGWLVAGHIPFEHARPEPE
jgi:hypothetical protein